MKTFFTSTFLSMEYWKLCQDWWWLWWWRFLAMWETTQKASRNCAQFELCGKDLPSLASFWKQRCCWAGFAGRHPSPRPEAAPAWLINVFLNNYTRSLQREKVNAQFPLSYISDISHQDWRSSGWWMKSIEREHFFKIKFDKIKFQKSWHQTLMLTQSRWERSIIPWKTRYFSFFFTPKDAWQRFCLIETWKFLEFTQDSLQERSSPLLSPYPASNLKQACSSACNEGTYFDKTAL